MKGWFFRYDRNVCGFGIGWRWDRPLTLIFAFGPWVFGWDYYGESAGCY
jgi:hypothetical protein